MADLTALKAVIHATTDTDREAVLDALNDQRLATDPGATDPDPLTTFYTGLAYGTRTTTDTGELLAAALLETTRHTAFEITQYPTDTTNGLYLAHTPTHGTFRAQCNTDGTPVIPVDTLNRSLTNTPRLSADMWLTTHGPDLLGTRIRAALTPPGNTPPTTGHRSPRIRPFLDLSTTHLTPATRDALDTYQGVLAYPTEHGWLMYAPESADDGRATAYRWPAELLPIVKLARAHGCAYVLLDADADETDELPTFGD